MVHDPPSAFSFGLAANRPEKRTSDKQAPWSWRRQELSHASQNLQFEPLDVNLYDVGRESLGEEIARATLTFTSSYRDFATISAASKGCPRRPDPRREGRKPFSILPKATLSSRTSEQ